MPNITTIHPFPARMAPDLARRSLEHIPNGGRVIDPMCGSGTVMRAAVEAGLDCSGFDIDPLSILMAKVWTTPIDLNRLSCRANRIVETAKHLRRDEVESHHDDETGTFIAYWFAPRQADEVQRLATVIRRETLPETDALAIALSRIIITKETAASLARDTSHSRPHKVASSNDYDVYSGFLRSVRQIANRLQPDKIKGRADVQLGDARSLIGQENSYFDLAITSPPYLNAIDYMRGHRLSLVWLGYNLETLRTVKSANVGSEKALSESETPIDVRPFVNKQENSSLQDRHVGWVRRYACDMKAVLTQLKRVVKTEGKVVMVVGNSFLRGSVIDNAGIVESLANSVGFHCIERTSREIPARRRYLPPPKALGTSALDSRMRNETVLIFQRSST